MPVRERARDLISRLTLDEKLSQLINKAAAIPRLGVPYYQWWSEALHGVAVAEGVENGISFRGVVKAATSFPQVILTASSFDAHLWYRIAKVIGTEARAMYNEGQATGLTFWAPTVNIFRDPRWGRGQETPGEDPLLTAKYATSFVRGLQGDSFEGRALKDDHLLVSACCKHFTAYDLESWKGYVRYTFNANVTKQDMADTYQPPFKGCIKEGKASGLMCAYNLVNGVPNCVDYDLLTETARGEWGFEGYITSDCDAVSFLFQKQHYAKSNEEAVADALKAGMDVSCGPYLGNYIKSAVLKGIVPESDIDKALENLFTVRIRLGLFNGPPSGTYGKLGREDVCAPEHQELALEAARQGIVLLKNERKLLPLSKAGKGSLAVIGPNANVSNVLLGNYRGPPCTTITPLQGLMRYAKDINYSSIDVKRAVELAKSADCVVLVMGTNQLQESEYKDREDLVLPGEQESLIMSVAEAAKKPVVLVLLCGGPIDVSFAKNEPKIGSILWAGYPGQAGGGAIAEIIFGDYNPGGRLTMTWYPQEFMKIPMIDMRMRADPSSGFPGRTYRFYGGKKVFEFGHGLSYTTYSYKIVFVSQRNFDLKASSSTSNLRYVSVQELGSRWCKKAKFFVIVRVKNKGKMAGKHPVLLFLRRTQYGGDGGVGSPMKQLVGFQTVKTDVKEKVLVKFSVSPCEHFSSASEDGEMVIESGDASLVVGDEEHPIRIHM
ncbi:probable beta-D-xylosidase 7 isoform X2 [Salvia splendens]|uniref:probable beta-D-xylosidase 7 isoform X2 n=2 Tax=Salvia splendens TaxID=180675 RepID=UPI001C25C341|nr:probable beta-D-xylosidase 7 isoform X2 [Salvia splendens]